MIECLTPPRPVRDAPPPETAANEYRLFRTWMKVESAHEVVWFNNVRLSLEFLALVGVSPGDLYVGVEQKDFDTFEKWAEGPGSGALDLERRHFACDVVGQVRDAFDAEPATVTFTIEDLLLHWLAYSQIARDLCRASPDWIPFFFRGGVPLGLDVVGRRMFEVDQRTRKTPNRVPTLTWMPGLARDKTRWVGDDPIRLFVHELESRRACGRNPFRVWALDTTFNGSSAFGNLEAAIKAVPSGDPPVSLTVAVILPVEDNVNPDATISGGPA